MKKLLLLLPLILCSCDDKNPLILEIEQHKFNYFPGKYIWLKEHYEHDPECPKCKEYKVALHGED